MERLHRLFQDKDGPLKAFLDCNRIAYVYPESFSGKLVLLLIAESHPNWPQVAEYLATNPILHVVELHFTKQEILDAPWCRLGVTSHFGYPQPEDGYEDITYKPGAGCRTCGVGWVQVAPFRFRKHPTQRRSKLLQLNWVFDEFFVSSDARAQIETAELCGMRFSAPVLHKSGKALPDWFQIEVMHTLTAALKNMPLTANECEVCHQVKVNYPQGEVMELDAAALPSTLDVVKTQEWFGSGGAGFRTVLVSQRFVRIMLTNGWRGVHLEPVIGSALGKEPGMPARDASDVSGE